MSPRQRCGLAELIVGFAVFVCGLLMGGPTLPALGACLFSLALPLFVPVSRKKGLTVALGILTLLLLCGTGLYAFSFFLRSSRYNGMSSPLWSVLIPAVALLAQAFFTLWTEDEPSLLEVRRLLRQGEILCASAFLGITLTYVLSMAQMRFETEFDVHICEGAVAAALALAGLRTVFAAFFAEERTTEEKGE